MNDLKYIAYHSVPMQPVLVVDRFREMRDPREWHRGNKHGKFIDKSAKAVRYPQGRKETTYIQASYCDPAGTACGGIVQSMLEKMYKPQASFFGCHDKASRFRQILVSLE